MSQRNKPNNKLRQQFGTRLRELRMDKGISQEELGFRADLHRTYVGAIERGEQNVSLDNIGRLAKTVGVKIKELFDFE